MNATQNMSLKIQFFEGHVGEMCYYQLALKIPVYNLTPLN